RLPTEQHHCAAGTTDGRRMIREDYCCAGFVCRVDQELRDRRRSRMEMHDTRAHFAQDGSEALRSDLIREAISQLDPTLAIGCEAVHCQAAILVFTRLNARCRDSR